MSDEEDYNSEEDLDYVPSDGEQVSEEENSGEEEDLSLLQDGEAEVKAGSRSAKRKGSGKKKTNIIEARKRKGGIKLDNGVEDQATTHTSSKEEENEEEEKRKEELARQILEEQEKKKEEKEKKRADDLWSSFMADVKKPTSRTPQSTSLGAGLGGLSSQMKPSPKNNVKESTSCTNSAEKASKVTITKVFDFAGEEIKITEEVDADSKEGKAEQRKQEKLDKEKEETIESETISQGGASILLGIKRPAAVGGLGSVLNKISKKTKMGTLEKSKLDWNSFKQKEGIEEDVKIHNKGKQGYTERMAFLSRADQRQFEIERDLRLGKNSKR